VKKNACLAVALAFATSAVAAPPDTTHNVFIHNGFVVGTAYRTFPVDMRMAYVEGMLDALYLTPLIGVPDTHLADALSKCMTTLKLNSEQAMTIVDRYLDADPTRWSLAMHWNTYQAINAVCTSHSMPLR
jgi:hypothetical protein